MRRTLNIGIGVGTAAIVASMAAGVASAATSGHQQAAGSAAAVSSVSPITRAQARHIARAKVPHSRVIEVESDDLHGRAVWKVKLATRHGRVVVDVDQRTSRATIVRGGGGGHDDAVVASRVASAGAGQSRAAGDDRGRDVRDRHDRGDRGDHRGDDHGRHHHDRGDRHDHDRGDDGPGR